MRWFALLLALTFTIPVSAQDQPKMPVPQPPVSPTQQNAWSVAGLDLPQDQTVNYDEGFVNLQATCKGQVQWLVISTSKVKYQPNTQNNSIVVSVPPTSGDIISVFAVGLVDGKLTEFARTNITISGPAPQPSTPAQPQAKLNVIFMLDNPTPAVTKMLASETLRKGVNERGHWFRMYDVRSQIAKDKKLDIVTKQVGGSAMIILGDDGKVLLKRPIPATEAEILAAVDQLKK